MSANFLEGFTVTLPRSAWDALLSCEEFMPETGEDVDYIASSGYAAIEQAVCEHLHRERYDWGEDHSQHSASHVLWKTTMRDRLNAIHDSLFERSINGPDDLQDVVNACDELYGIADDALRRSEAITKTTSIWITVAVIGGWLCGRMR